LPLSYILSVEAWIVAPCFSICPTVEAVMRLPLLGLNALVAVWLIAAPSRQLGLRPVTTFVAALLFTLPTPVVASQILEMFACVEPLIYARFRNSPSADCR